MAHYSLQCWGNTRWVGLLLVHGGSPLPSSARRRLSIQVLRLSILSRLLWLHCTHLLAIWRCLGGIRWRSTLVIWRVHVIVRVWLSMWVLPGVRVHLHICVRSILSSLSLLCGKCLLLLLSTLLSHTFEALLLLYARSWRTARAGFQSHRWYEGASELRLRDERMQFRLSRRPSFERVEIEQSLRKVNECGSVGHFFKALASA
jgi:hypothetical protein